MLIQNRQPLWNKIINRCQSWLNNSSKIRLEQELLTLVHGNTATANRLVNGEKRRHPNQTQQWYLEKVIYDLQRGR